MSALEAGEKTATKSGHALLREGAVSILALSKRGLFVTGKVDIINYIT